MMQKKDVAVDERLRGSGRVHLDTCMRGSMSRWAVLRAALSGAPSEAASRASIHRHDGFSNVLQRKRFFWTWTFRHEFSGPIDTCIVHAVCRSFVERADSSEIRVVISARGSLASELIKVVEVLAGSDPVMWRVDEIIRDRVKIKGMRSKKIGKKKTEPIVHITLFFHDRSYIANLATHEFVMYSALLDSSESPALCCVSTREAPRGSGVTARGIASHLLHGVDNTGNVRVWNSECILLKLLLSPEYSAAVRNKHLLELGGGMTGLCGLGLALSQSCASVLITDGHPDSVQNQKVCVELCKQKYPKKLRSFFESKSTGHVAIDAMQLRWSAEDTTGDFKGMPSLLDSNSDYPCYDVIIASDCLFFKDFHKDLYWLLRTATRVGGIVLLLQPPRGKTMGLFLAIVDEEKDFSFEIVNNYLPEVTLMHDEYLRTSDGTYDPDIHYPLLIKMTRLSAEAP